jgi:hypothetical protein
MKSGVSEIIGQAIYVDGARGTAYRALRPLFCASCGGVVASGEMFTRDRHSGQGLRLWPRCQACVPFAFAPGGNQTRSPLLNSLLTPTQHEQKEQTTTRKPGANEREANDKRGKTMEAMRQRLGPALEHARRTRSGNR